jgi:hypothetical protein
MLSAWGLPPNLHGFPENLTLPEMPSPPMHEFVSNVLCPRCFTDFLGRFLFWFQDKMNTVA